MSFNNFSTFLNILFEGYNLIVIILGLFLLSAAILIILAYLTLTNIFTIKKLIIPILYIIIDGILALQISRDIVPDFATAKMDDLSI